MTTPPTSGLSVPDRLDLQDTKRLATLLGSPSWGWLTKVVRAAWEPDLARRRARVNLSDLDEAQLGAMADFLRWPTHRTGVVTVDLVRLDGLLRSSGLQAGLATCLTVTGGPLADAMGARRAAIAARIAADENLWSEAAGHPALARHPELRDWLVLERQAGRLPRDPVIRQQILADALAVLAALPDPGLSLRQLAGRVLGPTHGLDSGPVPATVLRGVAWLTGTRQVPASAAGRRELWAGVGVALDTVSSSVLSVGLTVAGDHPVAVTLAANAVAALPVRLTLGQVQHYLRGSVAGPSVVWVCENPSVIEAAAERLGLNVPPLVCVEGHPSVAARLLLSALRAAGGQLRYHGDFDWPGLQIAAPIIAAGARPWRMGAQDYLSAVRGAHQNLPRLPALDGGAASAWDDRLVIDMHREGRQLEEEHVINDLLADLQVAGTRDCRFNATDENPA